MNGAVRTAFLLLLLIALPLVGRAQTEGKTVVGDSRGKEFWLAFPQNALLEQNRTLSLKLFITSDRATHGKVTIPGLSIEIEFSISPSEIKEIDIDTLAQILISEQVQNLGVHVVADNDVAVYGLSHRPASTDTYLALPVKVLGTTYRAIGYHSLVNGPMAFATNFTLIGSQDHTVVTISLKADSRGGHKAGETYSVSLNQGETYMVHGISTVNKTSDLTGSLITSTKPIGVLVGHSCAQVPPEISFCDQLLEMEPPVPSWGRQFYVGKFASKTEYAMRVVASEDNTQVFVNNKLVAKLAAGGMFENNHMRENAFVTASKPVIVAEYAQGSDADTIKVGDPFMMLVTPTEQFLNYYRFLTPVKGEWHHYINLVVPMDAVTSLRVDSRSVGLRYFQQIGISRYGIAQYEIGYGSHAISCDKPFGLYSYGFGSGSENYDSYGNDGGQLVETVPIVKDTTPPTLELVDDDGLHSLALIARDDRLFDVGLASIVVIDSDNFRTAGGIPHFDVGAPEVPLTFRVRDTSSCGFLSVKLTDAVGNTSYWVICRTSEGSHWYYTLSEGRENVCPSCRAWTAQFITIPAFTISNVTFRPPSYIKGPSTLTFDEFSPRLSGGFQGVYIYPYNKEVQLAGGIGFSNFTGAALATHTNFVKDSILYGDTAGAPLSKLIEQIATEASVSYLTLHGGAYYYAIPEKLYLYAGLATGFLISSSFVESSKIIFPATVADSTGRSTSAREVTLAQGSLPSPTKFLIALELSPGLQFKLSQRFSLLAGAYLNLPLFDATRDINWHLTTFGARLGLQFRR